MDELEDYVTLVQRGLPDLIEVKGVTWCGTRCVFLLVMPRRLWCGLSDHDATLLEFHAHLPLFRFTALVAT